MRLDKKPKNFEAFAIAPWREREREREREKEVVMMWHKIIGEEECEMDIEKTRCGTRLLKEEKHEWRERETGDVAKSLRRKKM